MTEIRDSAHRGQPHEGRPHEGRPHEGQPHEGQADSPPSQKRSSPNRRFATVTLASAVAPVTAPVLGKRGFGTVELMARWTDIVGPDIARYSLPLKLSFPRGRREQGRLEIKVEPVRAIQIQHLEPQILERINLTLGFSAVARLVLRQGHIGMPVRAPVQRPLTEAERGLLDAKLSRISASESLKAALDRLGQRVLARSSPA